MRASVVDLRRKMNEILAALDRGESVTILYHGKPRARLVPLRDAKGPRPKAREHPSFGMWANDEEKRDVEAYVRKLRRNRYDDL